MIHLRRGRVQNFNIPLSVCVPLNFIASIDFKYLFASTRKNVCKHYEIDMVFFRLLALLMYDFLQRWQLRKFISRIQWTCFQNYSRSVLQVVKKEMVDSFYFIDDCTFFCPSISFVYMDGFYWLLIFILLLCALLNNLDEFFILIVFNVLPNYKFSHIVVFDETNHASISVAKNHTYILYQQ